MMPTRTRRAVIAVAVVALVAAAFALRRPLGAWFGLGGGDANVPAPGHEGHTSEQAHVAFFTCPMHPSVRRPSPGRCPICGMDLVPVTQAENQGGVVIVDRGRRDKIGVRTTKVSRAPLALSIRAVGRLTYDETRLRDVTLKWRGFVTKLYVASTGQPVAKGQPLFAVYSPELYAAQREYLLALASRDREAATGPRPTAVDSLIEAGRKKLLLWDLTPAQIDEIGRKGAPSEQIDVRSPASGFVIEKNVVEGAAVEAGMRLYRIAALDRVWLEADLYEADLAHIKKGDRARITLPYLPGRELTGRVAYVYPFLSPATRTGRVRIELPNQQMELKPDMYANVTIDVALGVRLQIPVSAVIHTGTRRVVFVDRGEDRLEPVDVKLGARSGDLFEVQQGLEEGQLVVTAGNFLLASESRLRSSTDTWEDAGDQPDAR